MLRPRFTKQPGPDGVIRITPAAAPPSDPPGRCRRCDAAPSGPPSGRTYCTRCAIAVSGRRDRRPGPEA